MTTENISKPELLTFDNLAQYTEITHFISTRKGGHSKPPFGEFNLSLNSGEDTATVTKNRNLLAKMLHTEASSMVFPMQCHTGNVKSVNASTNKDQLAETDGLMTDSPGLFLCILVADCVPVLLFDPVKKVIAAVHAGWRGTVAGITGKSISMMKDTFGSQPENIIAAIGPSISADIYQVGPEVIEKVQQYYGSTANLVSSIDKEGKGFLNLKEANRMQLLHSGIKSEHIEISKFCTFQSNEIFYSARKETTKSGRFACGICIIE